MMDCESFSDGETIPMVCDSDTTMRQDDINRYLFSILGKRNDNLPQITGERGVPIFSGDSECQISVSDFIDRYLLFARAYNWTKEDRARILPLFLAGRALDFYASQKSKQKDFSEITKALKRAFDDNHSARCAALELRNRTQQPNESVSQYATALRKLAKTAFPRMKSADRNRQIVIDFIIGLAVPTVRNSVLDRDPEDMDEAEEIATRITNRMQIFASVDSSTNNQNAHVNNQNYNQRKSTFNSQKKFYQKPNSIPQFQSPQNVPYSFNQQNRFRQQNQFQKQKQNHQRNVNPNFL